MYIEMINNTMVTWMKIWIPVSNMPMEMTKMIPDSLKLGTSNLRIQANIYN